MRYISDASGSRPLGEQVPGHHATTRGVALALAAAAAAAAGCSPATPSTTSSPTSSVTASPTPTLDPAEVQEQEAVAAATATLTEFLRVSDEIGENGYADASALDPLVSGDLRPRLVSVIEHSRSKGARLTARATVESVEVGGYEPGPDGAGRERVLLDACVDNSTSEILLPDGSSMIDRRYAQRVVVTYTVQHQGDLWTVDDAQSDEARTC